MNNISVPLDRQRDGGVLNQNSTFRARFFVLNQEWCIFHLANVQNSSAGDRSHKKRRLVHAHYMGDGGKAWERGYLFLPNFLHRAKFTLLSAHPEVSFTWLMHPGEF